MENKRLTYEDKLDIIESLTSDNASDDVDLELLAEVSKSLNLPPPMFREDMLVVG